MASKVTKVITVSIGSEQIKLCEVVNNKKKVSVLWAATVPTPANSYDDGEIVDIERISRILKQTIYQNRIHAKNIIFTVQGSRVANKEIVIPNVKHDKIKAMIDANCAEYFPINTEEYVFAYSVLENFTEEGKKKLRLMVVAAPENIIDSYYTLAERLELKLESIDYIGNSTLQMLKQQVDHQPNIIIQINSNTTVVNIVKNGVLQLQRTVPYGKNVLLNAVADERLVDEARADELLKTEKLIHKSFDGDPITDSLRYMVSNLSRIVDYYTTRNRENPLETAYVITNGEELLGLCDLLSGELSMPATMLNELKNVSASKFFAMPDNHLMDCMENLGAVLEPVNFRSKKQIATTKKKEGKSNNRALLLGSVFISAVLVAYPYYNYSQAKEERDSLVTEIDKIKDIEKTVSAYYDAVDKRSEMERFLVLTDSNMDSALYMIEKLEEVMPSDITITSLSINNALVTLSAAGSSKVCVAKFLEELEKLENVYDIQISGVSETIDENENVIETFSLTFRFVKVIEDTQEAEAGKEAETE